MRVLLVSFVVGVVSLLIIVKRSFVTERSTTNMLVGTIVDYDSVFLNFSGDGRRGLVNYVCNVTGRKDDIFQGKCNSPIFQSKCNGMLQLP